MKIEGSDLEDFNVYFQANGPETTNIRWALERIIREDGLLGRAQTPNGIPCILHLEKYIQRLVWHATGGMDLSNIDMYALFANTNLVEGSL